MMTRDELIKKALDAALRWVASGRPDLAVFTADFCQPLLAAERERAIEECGEIVWQKRKRTEELANECRKEPLAVNARDGIIGYSCADAWLSEAFMDIRALRAPCKEQGQPGAEVTAPAEVRESASRESAADQADTSPAASTPPDAELRRRAEELFREMSGGGPSRLVVNAMLAFGAEREAAFKLNEYQAANLRSAIEAIGYPYTPNWSESVGSSPLGVLNSGDWLGELYIKFDLYTAEGRPNKTPKEYFDAANAAMKKAGGFEELYAEQCELTKEMRANVDVYKQEAAYTRISKDAAVAQQWAMEASRQRGIVLGILRDLGLPERDYEAQGAVRQAFADARARGAAEALDELDKLLAADGWTSTGNSRETLAAVRARRAAQAPQAQPSASDQETPEIEVKP